jgi:hypothetical protein
MNRSSTRGRAALGSFVLACAAALVSPVASAAPLLRAADGTAGAMAMLSSAAQQSLAAQVREARSHARAAFSAVANLAGLRPAVYRTTRYQRPSVARELRGLGTGALLPMLDVLAVGGYPHSLNAEERDVLEVGLLDAVGVLRDTRAEPVLRAAFLGSPLDAGVLAAAQGLGALCRDSDIAMLVSHRGDAGARGAAAIEGLGHCRRIEAVRPLAAAMDGATAPETVRAAARGLAHVGSTWAQQVASNRRLPYDPAVPTLAAQSLVAAYTRALESGADAPVRDELAYAILAVGHANSPRLLTEAAQRTTQPAARTALGALAATARRALRRR